MAELQTALQDSGLEDVVTYIQSGNVLFSSTQTDTVELAKQIHDVTHKKFGLDVGVVVLSKEEWSSIIRNAPAWWGSNPEWKHNLLILLKPFDMHKTVQAIGELKPDIETMEPGEGVLYQSMSLKLFGRTTTGKISSSPVYKQMTIRNYNTATKLLTLFD